MPEAGLGEGVLSPFRVQLAVKRVAMLAQAGQIVQQMGVQRQGEAQAVFSGV